MYQCELCGAAFIRPWIRRYSELLDGDGHRERRKEPLCPFCGQPYFKKAGKKAREDIRKGRSYGAACF